VAGRQLSAEEAALWARVAETVRPAGKRRLVAARRDEPLRVLRPRPSAPVPMPLRRAAAPRTADTLDGGWDRRLRQGAVAPDRAIDLHGHTLASAHAALDHALERALADDARLLLIVTGRAPRTSNGGSGDVQPRRGLIRAAIGDWLASSRHAGRIAAVRGAHPRHGGAGALYLILRRRR
jgi:DNA-nicking Smr family endonuclease